MHRLPRISCSLFTKETLLVKRQHLEQASFFIAVLWFTFNITVWFYMPDQSHEGNRKGSIAMAKFQACSLIVLGATLSCTLYSALLIWFSPRIPRIISIRDIDNDDHGTDNNNNNNNDDDNDGSIPV